MKKNFSVEIKTAFCYNILRKYGVILFTFAVILSALLCNVDLERKTHFADANADLRSTVILDAGHGGFDGGAVANDGTLEKNINLSIAFQIKHLLDANGFRVIMTRTDDTATDSVDGSIALRKKSDMQNRLALMERYPGAIYISIHLNKYTTSAAAGAQVFYTKNTEQARVLAEEIQQTICELLQPENDRVIKPGGKSTYILDRATVPAVIVECGFISNHRELQLLKDPEYQSKMAFAVAVGIINFGNGM